MFDNPYSIRFTKFGVPEISNTDQGSQFTSEEWVKVLKDAGVAISMDGKGRWIDKGVPNHES